MGIYGLINLPRHLTTNKTPLEVTSDSKQLSQYNKEEDEEVVKAFFPSKSRRSFSSERRDALQNAVGGKKALA